MKEELQTTLGDLYAIRAAMSLVVDNDERADPERRKISNIKRDIEDQKREIGSNAHQEEEALKEFSYRFLIEQEEEKVDELLNPPWWKYKPWERNICDPQHGLDELKKPTFFNVVQPRTYGIYAAVYFVLLALLFFIIGLIVDDILMYFVLPAVGLFAVIALFHTTMYLLLLSGYKSDFSYYTRKIKERDTEVEKIREKIEEYKALIAQGQPYLDAPEVHEQKRLTAQKDQACKQAITKLEAQIPEHQAEIWAIARQSNEIVESALKAYPIIDIRDWENVDLLIYYFETGRAEDMKEALQLVDRQKQTNQIVDALKVASESIRKSIDRSMAMLGTALSRSFSVLSMQLKTQHDAMMQGIDEERKSIVSTQQMNESLLRNINASSAKLAQQMDRQMREVHGLY